MISIIAAIASNNIIGNIDKIPWYLPADLIWFKNITLYKTIVMGRLTWDSIKKKPLKNRLNIIISKKNNYSFNSKVLWFNSIDSAIKNVKKEIIVIGGASIYKQFLKITRKMYLTHICTNPHGNVYFPKYEKSEWQSTFKEFHKSDKKNKYNYCFEILYKKNR